MLLHANWLDKAVEHVQESLPVCHQLQCTGDVDFMKSLKAQIKLNHPEAVVSQQNQFCRASFPGVRHHKMCQVCQLKYNTTVTASSVFRISLCSLDNGVLSGTPLSRIALGAGAHCDCEAVLLISRQGGQQG
jgi:hypothetical protein